MKIQKNISLACYTTFNIGGPARYFCQVETLGEIKELIKKFPKYFVLGGGSNILVADEGYDGLVIKIKNDKLKIINNRIYVDAGVSLGRIINESAKAGLSGLEWAIGIPGTIGGAVAVNASAFGCEMKNLVNKIKKYKDIILRVELKLKKNGENNLVQKYLAYRKQTQPLEYPCAGCIFKNPAGKSAGWLIDQCGLKGKRISGAAISKKHANFIINKNSARASNVLELIKLMKKEVKEKFGIELVEEIQYLGFSARGGSAFGGHSSDIRT